MHRAQRGVTIPPVSGNHEHFVQRKPDACDAGIHARGDRECVQVTELLGQHREQVIGAARAVGEVLSVAGGFVEREKEQHFAGNPFGDIELDPVGSGVVGPGNCTIDLHRNRTKPLRGFHGVGEVWSLGPARHAPCRDETGPPGDRFQR